jgi:hypothetical protein
MSLAGGHLGFSISPKSNNTWLISKDLLLRYYMEDGIENCHERSLQAANQVLLLFGLIENPRWPPARDIS